MKKKVTIELFTTNNELIFERDLETRIVKNFAHIKHISDLEMDMYANVELNDNLIDFAKLYMCYENIKQAVLWITNDYHETIDEIKISL